MENIERKQKLNIISTIVKSLPNFKKRERFIYVQIPRNFMNCAITIDNYFIANTNNSSNWDTLKFPLPKPKNKWEIKGYWGDIKKSEINYVKLVDYYWF